MLSRSEHRGDDDHQGHDGRGEDRADPEHPKLLQWLLVQSLILGEQRDSGGTRRIQGGTGHRIGDCRGDAICQSHRKTVIHIGLVVVHDAKGACDDDDAGDQFDDDGRGNAQRHAIIAESGVGDGVLIEAIDRLGQPDLQRHLFGSRQQETDDGAGRDAAKHLGDDVQHAIDDSGLAGEHRGDGNRRVEMRAGDPAENHGRGRIDGAGQQRDERHVDAVYGSAQRADRINGEADDEASDKFRADTKRQWFAVFFLECERLLSSSHSLSSVL